MRSVRPPFASRLLARTSDKRLRCSTTPGVDSHQGISAVRWQMQQPETPTGRQLLGLLFVNLDGLRAWHPAEELSTQGMILQEWALAELRAFQRSPRGTGLEAFPIRYMGVPVPLTLELALVRRIGAQFATRGGEATTLPVYVPAQARSGSRQPVKPATGLDERTGVGSIMVPGSKPTPEQDASAANGFRSQQRAARD